MSLVPKALALMARIKLACLAVASVSRCESSLTMPTAGKICMLQKQIRESNVSEGGGNVEHIWNLKCTLPDVMLIGQDKFVLE